MSLGLRTPGPIHLFSRFRTNPTSFYYLGTCVAAPEPEGEKFKIPVMNDIGGRSVPFQLVQDGELWYVVATMNRFNYNLWQSIRALEAGPLAGLPTTPLSGNPAVGGESQGARGTLSIGISDWELITLNEYANTVSSGVFDGTSDLPSGRLYYSCNLRKYKESTVGTRVQEIAVAVECQNVYQTASRSFRLYTDTLQPQDVATMLSLISV